MKDTQNSANQERRALAGILANGFFSSLGIGLFAFTVPLVSLDARISGAWLGSAFAGYYLAKLLAAPLSGLASDRFGARPLLLCATLTGALAPLLYLASQSLETLYAIQFILGLISGLLKPVGMAVLGSNTSRAPLAKYFALHALVFNIAVFTGPLLGGLLYLDRTIAPVLTAVSLCMGAAALLTAVLLPAKLKTKTAPQPRHISDGKTHTGALMLAIFGRTIGIGFLAAFYPILLSTALGRGITVAVLFAVPALAACLVLAAMNRYYGTGNEEALTVYGMLISACAMFFLGESGTIWAFLGLGCAMGVGTAISVPASMAMAARLSQNQGLIFGTAQFAAGAGFLLGPLVGGFLIPATHAIGPPLQLAAAIGALSCVPLAGVMLKTRLHFGRGTAWALALILAVILALPAGVRLHGQWPNDHAAPGTYRYTDVAMGTIVNLTLVADSRTQADRAAAKAVDAMRALQQDFDFRSPGASIERINRSAGLGWVKPSRRTFDLLKRTLIISEQSQGVFDPTVGAFTTSRLYFALDTDLARSKKALVDYRQVRLDEAQHRVRLDRQGMALDLGGIAKGTVIDEAVRLLKDLGIDAGIVEAGGDFYCFGKQDWTVGIRHPRSKTLYGTMTIRERGVCGSGDYQQFVTVEKDGSAERHHHIIDPATMLSADESIGATVIADSAERADALATTIFIMGPQAGRTFMDTFYADDAAIWFAPDQSVTMTSNFPLQ
ncbi:MULTISPECIES: MFS transporter [unclassified Pseudodesulfovibrio]|uniref:MFS transporter n=1 Tax=unclassified Pseudodesulfovibrio TaxID=2661612 RepID=UPI000FEB68A3|nr:MULTISPECIES: MFS transporter [unclassified Pseudodesulfovibrio]MCJ2164742.1 MFS transporter [Pseudodesulfovibrio sp. S3-i]RWU04070.1 MFS transporter [Pseudodesulfovibrio sp. S3]